MSTAIRTLAVVLVLGVAFPGFASEAHQYSDVPRVVALGDVHGDYHKLTRMLTRAGIIGPEHRWDGGPAHLVMTGDMVDRGPDSRRVLDFLMALQEQARKAGGRVHVLLGNHETMWLTGDYRYTSDADFQSFAGRETEEMRESAEERFEKLKERGGVKGDFASRFPPGSLALRQAMAPDGEYGRWLVERPVIVVINDTAFTHAGLSAEYAGLSARELNRRVREGLSERVEAWHELAEAGIVAAEYPMLDAARALKPLVESDSFDGQPRRIRSAARDLVGAPGSLIYDPEGPFWYRGNAACNALAEHPVVDRALKGLGADAMVVSHTPTRDGRIASRLDGRVIRIDTGERPSALVLEAEKRRALYADRGEPSPVVAEQGHPVSRDGLSAEEIEAVLSEGEVKSMEDVGTGVTNPQRVTLEHEGIRLDAVFKTEATPTRAVGGLSKRRIVNLADRHDYELAAYRLDRLLGLGMVPPAVERHIGQRTGTLQYWVEDAMNERQRRKRDVEPDPLCPLEKDYALLELFDRLIYNTDRTQENILYLPNWRVALIDHTRAFRTKLGKPDAVRDVDLAEAPGFAKRLAQLDRDALNEALAGVLDRRQIRALRNRRDAMLAEWRAHGKDEVAAQ